MHFGKNVFTLTSDPDPDLRTELVKVSHHLSEWLRRAARIDDHHHIEVSLHDGLGDILHIDLVAGKVRADSGNDSHRVFPDYGYDSFVHSEFNPLYLLVLIRHESEPGMTGPEVIRSLFSRRLPEIILPGLFLQIMALMCQWKGISLSIITMRQ